MNIREPVLQVEHVKTSFTLGKTLLGKPIRRVRAVDDVSFCLRRGDTLGIVGESGCGKSTLARTVLRLVEPEGGTIYYEGTDLGSLSREEMRLMRKRMQIVFQDPYASLNPRMTVKDIIESPLRVFQIGTKEERLQKVIRMMEQTGLKEEYLERYPHEFSGGQRQRIIIARALILHPGFLVCDEPVSALDVSVRSQVLNLMKDLKEKMDFSSLFISHDLSVVKYICDQVAVMYLGRFVELADMEELYGAPAHPYTQALLASIPLPSVRAQREHQMLKGEVPSPLNPPDGCYFHPRCPRACERCAREAPVWREISPDHWCACHNV